MKKDSRRSLANNKKAFDRVYDRPVYITQGRGPEACSRSAISPFQILHCLIESQSMRDFLIRCLGCITERERLRSLETGHEGKKRLLGMAH